MAKYNRYIKVDGSDMITDVFYEYQTDKFDGSEIMLNTTSTIIHKLRISPSDPWESITDEFGNYKFRWLGGDAIEKVDISAIYLESFRAYIAEVVSTAVQNHFNQKRLTRDKKDKKITKYLDDSDSILDTFHTDLAAAATTTEMETLRDTLFTDLGIT